ncbi:hypothetical protein [Salibacterium aidingense]|uniref:hypothetical protein n=1 Tax=Salibacterium aidingense TaxID=384933 RepID=UPI000422EC10|nr:hypothetical protein [Salibacterium aidingense]
MNDYIANSVQSFVSHFGLNWCRRNHHLKNALQELYGNDREDIILLTEMLEDGTVEKIEHLDLQDEPALADWIERVTENGSSSVSLTRWALHTWVMAVRRESVFEEVPSPLSPPVIEAEKEAGPAVREESQRISPPGPALSEPNEEHEDDIVSLMQYNEPLDEADTASVPPLQPSKKHRSIWMSGAAVVLLAALVLVMMWYREDQPEAATWENGGAAQDMENSDWITWLKEVETADLDSSLVIPGCEAIEKGETIETENGPAEETVIYPDEKCSLYAKNGTIYAAGRKMTEWQPPLEDIEHQIGSPDRLNVEARTGEIRALYQRESQDIFLIFTKEHTHERLSYVEIGDIHVDSEEPADLLEYPR